MKLSQTIQNKLLSQYHLNEFLLIELDVSGQVIDYQGAHNILPELTVKSLIQDHIAGLATETFETDFFIPFYHLSDHQVIDLHHFIDHQRHHLVLLPQDHIYRETQLKQQVALESQLHNQNLESMLSVLQHTQKKLQQANKDKSFLLSALSHEMGTPLNSIQGHAQMAIEDPSTTEHALQIIIKNGQQLQNIINQTLNIDNNQSHSNRETFDLSNLLNELHDDLMPLASFKGLSFDTSCAANIQVYSNKAQWQQILTNLITNAIKYTDNGGLNVEVTVDAQSLIVAVKDTGIGISPAFQKKLFQTWQREHKDQAKGSGIGLAIAKMLADEMGLELRLAYSSDEGSSFQLVHPNYQHQIQHVLLIEDDEDLRRLFVFYLQQLNMKVTQAASWEEVTSQAGVQFDAILTDRNLADGQADDQLQLLKSLAEHILVMTGNPSQEQVSLLLQKGFDRVLAKPLSQSQIEQALFS